jgi:hypothetical protein
MLRDEFKPLKAIGIVFLYDRSLGSPQDISKNFVSHFSSVSENLVMEKLVLLNDLKEIMDAGRIYWAGIKENFENMIEDEDTIGKIAWKVFADHTKIEPSEEVKSLIYKAKGTPWKFNLLACVLYE